MTEFTIYNNYFLNCNTVGFHNTYYIGFKKYGNPDFLNTLKNTFNNISMYQLKKAADSVIKILRNDLPLVIQKESLDRPLCVCVPRSRANMSEEQMLFQTAVSVACCFIDNIEDGTTLIVRKIDTATTHLARSSAKTDGPMPYRGITKDTCAINKSKIYGRNIILVDDIYTRNCNIDEDCIQALYDCGAKKVVFYSVAYTQI